MMLRALCPPKLILFVDAFVFRFAKRFIVRVTTFQTVIVASQRFVDLIDVCCYAVFRSFASLKKRTRENLFQSN